jgi:phosphocarrier protein
MINKQTEIINKLGLHARAAAKLVATASKYASETNLKFGNQSADAKSIMSVMMLAAGKGSLITIECTGLDEEAALQDIISLIENYFGEEE